MNHHAYLLQVKDVVSEEIPNDIKGDDCEMVSHIFGAMSIDAVRSLIDSAYTKSLINNSKLIVIRADSINIEAQQALLKVLEEPPISTRFLFLLKRGSVILPTLRSRFYLLSSHVLEDKSNDVWQDFLLLSLSKQIEAIADKTKNKDLEWIGAIKSGLFSYLEDNKTQISIEKLNRLLSSASLISTRGASNKMLLEDMAIVLKE
jgi:DNA polymerase III delta prime subunit